MISINKFGAQGDVFFKRIASVPNDAVAVKRKGALIVAHSETGHHHVIEDPCVLFEVPGNPLVAYLQLEGACADVVHQRPWDTHETMRLLGEIGAVWEVRKQREWAPEGWRRVAD
jgi:hypothetical protein